MSSSNQNIKCFKIKRKLTSINTSSNIDICYKSLKMENQRVIP